MRLGKLVVIKPLEKPLLTINCESIKGWTIALFVAVVFMASPFLFEIGMAMLAHAEWLKRLTRYVCEVP